MRIIIETTQLGVGHDGKRAQAVTGLTVTFLQAYTKPKHHWEAYSQPPGNPGMYYNNIWMKVPLASMKGRPRAAPGHKATHF